jgi:hypothetical protein
MTGIASSGPSVIERPLGHERITEAPASLDRFVYILGPWGCRRTGPQANLFSALTSSHFSAA